MPKHPTKGTRAGMSATAGRTGRRTAPGKDSLASARAGAAGRRNIGPKKRSSVLGKLAKGFVIS